MALLKNITSGSIDGIVITGSLDVSNGITGSLFGTASWALNAVTAAFALNGGGGGGGDITGSQYYAAIFSSNTALRTGSIYDSGSFTAIGASTPVDPANPDRLFIDAGDTTSYNLLSGHGTINNYLQLNIQNFSSDATASSDIVATADNGTEDDFYVNMGINSSGYNIDDGIGQANDSYLYNVGGDLLIGNASSDKRVIIFNGGTPALDNARVYITQEGTVGINASDVSLTNPEALLVEPLSGSTTNDFNNLIIGRGEINENYLQLNITNLGTGSLASSDIVATNDIGDESSYYIDMGINSSNYNTPNTIGMANDAYLYSTAEHLHIGNASANMPIMFFAGGLDSEANKKFELWPDNQHQMSGSLNITGSLTVLEGITGSLFGTASWALNTLTASTATTALTASYADNFTVAGTLTAQTIVAQVITSSTEYITGSTIFGSLLSNTHEFTGSVSITGSLTVAGTTNITGSLAGTSSWAINALTASYVNPLTQNVIITGSLSTSGSVNIKSSGSAVFSVDGTSGRLFSVDDSLSGSLFSVNTAAGLPIIEAFSDNTVRISQFGQKALYVSQSAVGIGKESDLNGKLDISGSTFITGSLNVSSGITGSLFGTSSWATNAISSSYPIAITGSTIYSIGTRAGGPTFDGNSTYRNVFLGWQAGVSSSAYESLFIGNNAGFRANPGYATFIGLEAGYSASNANESNFIGLSAGSRATNANNSNFLGKNAGFQASEAAFATFLGGSAGAYATNAYDSTFVGFSAGASATDAYKSQFIGEAAGEEARNAFNSSIIGYFAGYYARNANNAVFIGESAGAYAASASYSILIGKQAGASPGGDQTKTIGSNNIIIGHNLTLPAGRKNSINLGAVIFATGSYFSSGNPDFDYTLFSGSVGNGRVGINQPNPTFNLDVSGSGRYTSGLIVTGSVTATTGFTGSLFGTASWAQNALTSSYIPTLQEVTTAGNTTTNNVIISGSLITTGSISILSSSLSITNPVSGLTRVSTYRTDQINLQGTYVGIANNTDFILGSDLVIRTYGSINRTIIQNNAGITLTNYSGTGTNYLHAGANGVRIGGNDQTISARLHVSGSDQSLFLINSATAGGVFYVSGSGNVGIGTTAPTSLLHISASNSVASSSFLVQNSSGQTLISVLNNRTVSINDTNSANGDTSIGTTNGTINFIRGFNNTFIGNALTFYSVPGTNTIQGFNANPGIAIGYSQTVTNPNPGTALSIRGTTTTSGSAVLFVTGSSSTRLFRLSSESNADVFVVSGSGRVGIGTATPNAILDVNGNAIITGSLTVTNGITGSLFGTSSWAENAVTSSYVLNAISSSFADFAVSSSYPIAITGSTIYNSAFGTDLALTTNNAIALGYRAGEGSSAANASIMLGIYAGQYATNATDALFMFSDSGYYADNADNSIMIGTSAGSYSTNANNSTFLNTFAGYSAPEANNAFFAGQSSGQNATSASNSSFIGRAAGYNAYFANNSRFLGFRAGQSAASGSYSTLLGFHAGYASTEANTIGRNNIIIGTGISLPAGRQDSINLGGIIFATGSYFTTTENTSFSGSLGNGRVGINVVNPTQALDVSGSANFTGAVTASTAFISGSGTNILTVIGSGSAQPIFTVQGSQGELFSITDSLSGSLFSVNDISGLPILEVFSDNTTLMGSYLAPSLNTTVRTTTTNSGSFTIYSVPTSSYDGLFMEYTAKSGSAARAGQFMSIWSGSSVNFTDNSTTDFGDTSRLAFTGSISGSNIVITGNVTVGSGWTVKAIIRSI